MNRSALEIVAMGSSVVALVGWTAFWLIQVKDVIEILEMAYG